MDGTRSTCTAAHLSRGCGCFDALLATALTAITAAVVGVILNLAIWFAWHALRPDGTGFDTFVAVIAVGSWVAMERFETGVIPTLAVCAALGMIWKLV